MLVTTYEVANIEKTSLNKIGWRYLIIDEAHRCDVGAMPNNITLTHESVVSFGLLWHQGRVFERRAPPVRCSC